MVQSSILQDKEKVREAVLSSETMSEVLVKLNLRPAGGNYKSLHAACEKFDIQLPVYTPKGNFKTFSNDAVFVEHSRYSNGTSIKKRLYALGVPEECNRCGQGSSWNGMPLTLTLEHINGIHNDNRMENLEILCPNCHTQKPTFAGRGIPRMYLDGRLIMGVANPNKSALTRGGKPYKTKYCECGQLIHIESTRCNTCNGKQKSKARYPELNALIQMVSEIGYSATGRKIGVSDNAVRKHIDKQKLMV